MQAIRFVGARYETNEHNERDENRRNKKYVRNMEQCAHHNNARRTKMKNDLARLSSTIHWANFVVYTPAGCRHSTCCGRNSFSCIASIAIANIRVQLLKHFIQ